MTKTSAAELLKALGFASPTAAARAYGVSTQVVYRHLSEFGCLDGLKAGQLSPPAGSLAVPMPDGTIAPSIAEAARLLGVEAWTAGKHLEKYGHLRFVKSCAVNLPDMSAIMAPPGSDAVEMAPSASRIPYRKQSKPRVDVEAVIATIRQCRDQYVEALA